jgi:hypothetical protein
MGRRGSSSSSFSSSLFCRCFFSFFRVFVAAAAAVAAARDAESSVLRSTVSPLLRASYICLSERSVYAHILYTYIYISTYLILMDWIWQLEEEED